MYRILSLSGGGIRGYISALTLAEIERRSGKQISEMFDLIVGTSIGSLIGANLLRMPAEHLPELFKYLAPSIFQRNKLGLLGLVQSIYNTDKKNNCIKELLDYQVHSNLKYGFVSYDIKNRQPVIFSNVKHTKNSCYTITNSYSIVDAVCASSSAPLYWNPYKLDNMLLVDGALISNSPVSIGVKLAQNKDIRLDDMAIVNIGTGKLTRQYHKTNGGNIISWVRPLIDILIDGQSELTNMCYEDEGLDYFNLDIDLLNGSDDLDNITSENFYNLELDSKRLIELHTTKIDRICSIF